MTEGNSKKEGYLHIWCYYQGRGQCETKSGIQLVANVTEATTNSCSLLPSSLTMSQHKSSLSQALLSNKTGATVLLNSSGHIPRLFLLRTLLSIRFISSFVIFFSLQKRKTKPVDIKAWFTKKIYIDFQRIWPLLFKGWITLSTG